VWIIGEVADIRAIQEAFLSVGTLYIADGHHRAAAAVRVAGMKKERQSGGKVAGERDFMLAVLFPANQLRIMDYNRAVRDLNGLSVDGFLERIGEKFLAVKNFREKMPRQAHEFGMYLQGNWYLLSATEKAFSQEGGAAALDVAILQENILGPVLGIENPRTDKRIAFIGGSRVAAGLEGIVENDGFAVAFSLFPPTVEKMMEVADAGMTMPPKSTWFEPKLRSGLFVHLID
jgi:uncharacterized protein (DUF1015 family)